MLAAESLVGRMRVRGIRVESQSYAPLIRCDMTQTHGMARGCCSHMNGDDCMVAGLQAG